MKAPSTNDPRLHLLNLGRPVATDPVLDALILRPWRNEPAFQRAFASIRKGTIGAVHALHIRVVRAGQGGWDPDLAGVHEVVPQSPLQPTEALARDLAMAADLATEILGPVAEIAAWSYQPGEARSCLFSWRHRRRRSFSSVEWAFCPDLSIRSPADPRQFTLEATGSAGILWLELGPGTLRCEPVLRILQGEDTHTLGGLDLAPFEAMAACLNARRPPARSAAIRLLAACDVATQSLEKAST